MAREVIAVGEVIKLKKLVNPRGDDSLIVTLVFTSELQRAFVEKLHLGRVEIRQ